VRSQKDKKGSVSGILAEEVKKMKAKGFICAMWIVFLSINLGFGSGEKIPMWSVNAGGNIHSYSTDYKLSGSAAQPVAGHNNSVNNHAYAGFCSPWLRQVSTDVEEEKNETLPLTFSLSQNYPNPFNPQTVIQYALPHEGHVNILVYNVLGQKVKVLKDEVEEAGYKTLTWDGKDETGSEVASGIYFYRLQAKNFVKCKKMLLLK
jgi:hypothetical protein